MPKLLLDIPDLAKVQEFLAHLTFIENVEVLEDEPEDNAEKNEAILYYDTDKYTYTVEDIEAIMAQFPEDY